MSRLLDTIFILGTEYEIYDQDVSENPKLDDAFGISEFWTKSIIIDTSVEDDHSFDNMNALFHKVLRHEAFHCILHEAGADKYSKDEDLVDMLAILYPKIKEIMDRLDNIDLAVDW